MTKYVLLSIVSFGLSVSTVFATTVGPASIRYTISNHTGQRIRTVIQLESADHLFTQADTVCIVNDVEEGFLQLFRRQNDPFKPYIKLLIRTSNGTYSTPALAYRDRCTAYTINLTGNRLFVEESNFYRYRRQVISVFIMFLFLFSAKGIPLILFAARYIKAIYVPFLLINSLLVIALLILPANPTLLLHSSPVPSMYALGMAFLLESTCYYWLSQENRQKSQLIAASILGTILWLIPYQLMALLFQFLFAGC